MTAPGRKGPVDLVLDGAGLSLHGPARRRWHLTVLAGTGEILAHEPSDSDASDAASAPSRVSTKRSSQAG
ncbi:MAG: hypothetical protein ACFBWO_07450 [Paracoccaceae bacterium]